MATENKVIGNHHFNIALSVIGMLIVIYGTLLVDLTLQKQCYLSGGFLMLISAMLERQTLFAMLQFIISTGALIAFAPFASLVKALVPLGFSVIAIIYFAKQGLLKDKLTLLGSAALIVLAIGYAVSHPLVYLCGAILLTWYSFGAYRRGIALGLLWGILNAIFVVTSSIAVYRVFM
jgi:hypothetical protein